MSEPIVQMHTKTGAPTSDPEQAVTSELTQVVTPEGDEVFMLAAPNGSWPADVDD